MVAEGYLRGAELLGDVVQDAAAQPRAERAVGLPLRHLGFDDRVGVSRDDAILVAAGLEMARQHVGGKPGLALVEVDGDQRHIERRLLPDASEQMQERQRVLAAAHADHHAVTRLEQLEIVAGAGDLGQETLLEAGHRAPTLSRSLSARRPASPMPGQGGIGSDSPSPAARSGPACAAASGGGCRAGAPLRRCCRRSRPARD